MQEICYAEYNNYLAPLQEWPTFSSIKDACVYIYYGFMTLMCTLGTGQYLDQGTVQWVGYTII